MVISGSFKTMKITVEQENRKFTLEIPEDLDIYEMADEMRIILYAMTFCPESVQKIIPE